MPPRARRNNRPPVPFVYKLALNQWLFGLFDLPSTDGFSTWNGRRVSLLDAFKQKFQISEDAAGGLDENNVHRFHHALTAQLFNLTQLPTELLLEYDQNIVKHTQRLNERRLTRGERPRSAARRCPTRRKRPKPVPNSTGCTRASSPP